MKDRRKLPATQIRRLRVFAGPNGSGKTTLMEEIKSFVQLNHVVNPDEIEQRLLGDKFFDMGSFGLLPDREKLLRFVGRSTYPPEEKAGFERVHVDGQAFDFSEMAVNSYTSALFSGFLRHSLIEANQSFSFESVFSHASKLEELKAARAVGYRVYLYFVATGSPALNTDRVRQRVETGVGHDVPVEKILKRYRLALENLLPALRLSYRAYVFDNSGKAPKLIAEADPKGILHLKTRRVPVWFDQYVLRKTEQSDGEA